MTSLRILTPALLTCFIVSCASQQADQYDTVGPATADNQVNAPVNPPANPVYDTPAAYQETTATSAMPPVPSGAATRPNLPAPPVVAKAPSNGAAIIHTVVAGDTLSGISAKYKVPVAAIKQANGMTKDIVVLGKKMAIPPAR
jgi:LysM repeat protein